MSKKPKNQSLATFYRPNTWESYVGQDALSVILKEQIKTGTFKNAYAFCGPSGTGKTTVARLFANEINNHKGTVIELDMATNGTVEKIREITDNAKKKSLDSDYKIFILDEIHLASSAGFGALLKTLEDTPKSTIFMLATTEFDKIPATIKNRVQVFTLSKIPTDKIFERLKYIAEQEELQTTDEALQMISKMANGGMRDGIAMLDKVQSLNKEITIENVIKALGTENYQTHFDLMYAVSTRNTAESVKLIEGIYNSGKDLKAFISQFKAFVVDVCKYKLFEDTNYIQIPATKEYMALLDQLDMSCYKILDFIIDVSNAIKWENNPLYAVQALFISYLKEEK